MKTHSGQRHVDSVVGVTKHPGRAGAGDHSLPRRGLVLTLHDGESGDKPTEVSCSPPDPPQAADVAFVEAVAGALDGAEGYRSSRLLDHPASLDSLTGLLSRAGLDGALQAAMTRRTSVVALAFELDGLRQVNDRYGQRAVDEAIVVCAERLREASRGTDLVARTGCDAFVVICWGMSLAKATSVGDRIGRAMTAPIVLADHRLELAVGIGIAHSDDCFRTLSLEDAVAGARHGTEERQRVSEPRGAHAGDGHDGPGR